MDSLVGHPVDIAPSAYQYRADRKAGDNPPESWLALLHYAGLPLNEPVDVDAPAIRRVLLGLLWEEIRPVHMLELIWTADSKRRPAPEDLEITILNAQGGSSSWWNNLGAAKRAIAPTVSPDGSLFVYTLNADTCGIVVSTSGARTAADLDVPAVRVLVADVWKKMDVEIEWGFAEVTRGKDYSGRLETYDGRVAGLRPLEGDDSTFVTAAESWRSEGAGKLRRGIAANLLYMGTSNWRRQQPFTTQPDGVARTIITLWTKAGSFSFLAADLENGPILAPEFGFFVRRTSGLVPSEGSTRVTCSESPIELASEALSAREYIQELHARQLETIRQQTREHEEQTWEGAVTAMCGADLPPHPEPPAEYMPSMQVHVPSERLTAQWNLGTWHLLRHAGKNPKTGRLWFDDFPYGVLAAETYMVLRVLDLMGAHGAAADGFDQWLSLPLDHKTEGDDDGSLPDRPSGLFSEGHGGLTLAQGPEGIGDQNDVIHSFGPGSIGWALTEHYWMTGDTEWLKASAPRIKANAEWMLRQRKLMSSVLPGGDRLWCKGLQPALQVTPDSGGLWLQFYECEAYYWASVSRFAATLAEIDPKEGARLAVEAEAYGKDLRAAVERSIALSPVVPVRDGTYHSVIPAACYVRGLCTGAWGWKREGSGEHVGPLYWDTVQSAAALISPAGLLPASDVRVQGYLDVLEDRLLLENTYVAERSKGDWFMAGWQYQGGLERTANLHLAADDIPVFLRSFFNCYAVDILPIDGFVFNEHAVHGPPDKIFEEAAFLERFRNMLVMEDGRRLWLARAIPRAWLIQGERISVKQAPTHFGVVDYEIVSDADHSRITASVTMPPRNTEIEVWLRVRHPKTAPIKGVTVNGKQWKDYDPGAEVVGLHGVKDTVAIEVRY